MPTAEVQPRPLFYSIRDAGRMVGLSRSTLYELMKTRQLDFITFGRRRLITHDALEDLAQRMREGTVAIHE